MTTRPNHEQRFMSYVSVVDGDCWEWRGKVKRDGSLAFIAASKEWSARRWAFCHFVGEPPEGMIVASGCGDPLCVNPSHLHLAENSMLLAKSKTAKQKYRREDYDTHCTVGHAYADEGMYVTAGRNCCKRCNRERLEAWRIKNPNLRSAQVARYEANKKHTVF